MIWFSLNKFSKEFRQNDDLSENNCNIKSAIGILDVKEFNEIYLVNISSIKQSINQNRVNPLVKLSTKKKGIADVISERVGISCALIFTTCTQQNNVL